MQSFNDPIDGTNAGPSGGSTSGSGGGTAGGSTGGYGGSTGGSEVGGSTGAGTGGGLGGTTGGSGLGGGTTGGSTGGYGGSTGGSDLGGTGGSTGGSSLGGSTGAGTTGGGGTSGTGGYGGSDVGGLGGSTGGSGLGGGTTGGSTGGYGGSTGGSDVGGTGGSTGGSTGGYGGSTGGADVGGTSGGYGASTGVAGATGSSGLGGTTGGTGETGGAGDDFDLHEPAYRSHYSTVGTEAAGVTGTYDEARTGYAAGHAAASNPANVDRSYEEVEVDLERNVGSERFGRVREYARHAYEWKGVIAGVALAAAGGYWASRKLASAAAELAEAEEQDCRTYYESHAVRGSGVPYSQARTVYVLGYVAARNPDYAGRGYDEVEPHLRSGYTGRRAGSYDTLRDFGRRGYERGSSRGS